MSPSTGLMLMKDCCKSCRHYISSQNAFYGACRLRKIKLHSDIVTICFCHHWTPQEIALPNIDGISNGDQEQKQLDFGKVLVGLDL